MRERFAVVAPIRWFAAQQITLSRFETLNGVRSRRFYPLALERSSVVFVSLAWTSVHPITQSSPLDLNPAQLEESSPGLLVVVHAVDDVIYQRITARTSYGAEEVV